VWSTHSVSLDIFCRGIADRYVMPLPILVLSYICFMNFLCICYCSSVLSALFCRPFFRPTLSPPLPPVPCTYQSCILDLTLLSFLLLSFFLDVSLPRYFFFPRQTQQINHYMTDMLCLLCDSACSLVFLVVVGVFRHLLPGPPHQPTWICSSRCVLCSAARTLCLSWYVWVALVVCGSSFFLLSLAALSHWLLHKGSIIVDIRGQGMLFKNTSH